MLFMSSQTQIFLELTTHPLKSNYYQVISIIFSIFRTMDLYQFTKYESISERIKRLASPPSVSSPSPPLQNTTRKLPFQTSPSTLPQKVQDEKLFRVNFKEKTAPSRATTQETTRNQNQQSQTLINELMSARDYVRPKPQHREINFAFTQDESEVDSPLKQYGNQRIFEIRQQSKEEQVQNVSKLQLSKVKSQSSLKLDEILQSYNNYKKSRQQFLSQMKQNEDHQKVLSQNLNSFFEKQSDEDPKSSYRISQIDSLWNQVPGSNECIKADDEKIASKENLPTFKRSQKRGEFQQLKRLRDTEVIERSQKPAVHRRSLSRLIVRNGRGQKQIKQDSQQTLNMVLSPRGSRVPGRICKNVDRSTIPPLRGSS